MSILGFLLIRGRVLNISPEVWCMGILWTSFIKLKNYPFILSLLSGFSFIISRCYILLNTFSAYIERITFFLLEM